MRLKHPDLMLTTAIALANVVWAFLPFRLPIIGTILALPLVFIAPGYPFTGALFHGRSLDRAYRLLLSLGISVSIVIVSGLLLNALPVGLRPSSWSVLLAFLTLLFSALALYLRRKTPPLASPPDVVQRQTSSHGQTVILSAAKNPTWRADSGATRGFFAALRMTVRGFLKLDRVVGTRFITSASHLASASHLTPIPGIASTHDPRCAPGIASTPRPASTRLAWHGWIVCLLALLVLVFSIVFSASSVAQQPHTGFTQFWILPSNQPGTACSVRLGIQSYELTSETYRVVVTANGNEESVWPSIQLAPRQQWDQSVSIRSIHSGPLYIEARLYLAHHPQVVYREVHITMYISSEKGCEMPSTVARHAPVRRDAGGADVEWGPLWASFVAICTSPASRFMERWGWKATRDAHKGPHSTHHPPASLRTGEVTI